MSGGVGYNIFKLSTQKCPIFLNNGVAANIPFKMLPIIAITESINFVDGLLSGGNNIGLDHFFADFQVIPGGTLIDQQIGKYPFANQQVAANAVIPQPLKLSMLMICPVRQQLGYAFKLGIMTALQKVLQKHNLTGGTYTVVTPSTFYTNLILTNLSDASNSSSKQLQNAFRWDFEQPLLTQEQAATAQQFLNSKMDSVTNQATPIDGSISGWQAVQNQVSGVGPSAIPAGSGAGGFSVASPSAIIST